MIWGLLSFQGSKNCWTRYVLNNTWTVLLLQDFFAFIQVVALVMLWLFLFCFCYGSTSFYLLLYFEIFVILDLSHLLITLQISPNLHVSSLSTVLSQGMNLKKKHEVGNICTFPKCSRCIRSPIPSYSSIRISFLGLYRELIPWHEDYINKLGYFMWSQYF